MRRRQQRDFDDTEGAYVSMKDFGTVVFPNEESIHQKPQFPF